MERAMKFRSFFIAFALGVGLISAPAQAQSVDPCSVYICMAGFSGVGDSGGPACGPPVDFFFAIAVYDPWFDAGATSRLRENYLKTCPGTQAPTNSAILELIIALWGMVP